MAENDVCYLLLAEACISKAREDYIEAKKNLVCLERDTPECLKRRAFALKRITSAMAQEFKRWSMPPTEDERQEIIERRLDYYRIVNNRTIINVTHFLKHGWLRDVVGEETETIIKSWDREVDRWAQ